MKNYQIETIFNKYIKWAARLKLSVSTQIYYCFLAGGLTNILN